MAVRALTGVWKLRLGAGREELLVRLTTDGATLSGEISSPRMGTISITDVTLNDDDVRWVVPIASPVAIDLSCALRVQGDTMLGEADAGDYGTSILVGRRTSASEWRAWPTPHVHRSVVRLPDGTEVTAVSYDAHDPYGRERQPDFGLYLDRRWAPPWSHTHLDWPDFGLFPGDPQAVVDALENLVQRARGGERVEIGCLGGHGRTGTALAWMAVLLGEPGGGAVSWVRSNYCPLAVETEAQEAFVAALQRSSGPALGYPSRARRGPGPPAHA